MKKYLTVPNMSRIAILAALGAVLMLFDFPIFVAPSFYKLDFSEAIVLLGTFALGPVSGVLIELLKILINLLLNGTVTMYIGELSNFILGIVFILPAGIIYNHFHNKKGAYASMIISTIFLVIAGSLINAYILIPVYAKIYGIDINQIFLLGNKSTLLSFVLLCVVPFNLIKGILNSLITAFLYKKISFIIKNFRNK